MRPQTAIVTGAGQGIGARIAADLAVRGLKVAIADIDEEKAEAVAAGIRADGGGAFAAPVDITDPASVAAMVAMTQKRLGGIGAFVSSARWTGLKSTPVEQITDEDWNRAMTVNVTGVFNCIRAVTPAMIVQGSGRIVVLSSATVTLPPTRPYVHYITSKAALIGMVRALARELGTHRITVNAVLPGAVETGVERGGLSGDERQLHALNVQSVPEIVRSKDITGIVAFLVSDESSLMTGQSLTVDGGRSFL
ncbi:SDR family NAD(P)-dependent oxidoreductase [Aliihoeflea sp. PC F10.4]